ncbi:MAG: xanthine dehydrogenase family protein molybdopterin-binding subunit, partial [Acidimicrobiia bacterium]
MRRVEDEDLLLGRALFTDDLEAAREAAHLALVRSPFPHALVRLGSPPQGAYVVVAEDVPDLTWPHLLPGPPPRRALAQGRVRFVGEAVAAIVTDDARTGSDLAAEFDVDYEPLDAATSVELALAPGSPLVYQELGTNVAYRDQSASDPELFADADAVIKKTFRQHRIAPAMMECRAILAVPDGRGGIVAYVGHQNAHKFHGELTRALGLESDQVRVVVPNVGGAFGAKGPLYSEYLLAAWAALQLGRPVKYIETRSENLLLTVHGRGQTQRVEAGVTRDGRITALKVAIDGELGAAVDSQRWCLASTRVMISGAYRIPRIEWDVRGVLTHTPPVGAFRGAGRPEAAYLIERLVDEVARDLDIDPKVVRERNFIEPDSFPYRVPTGGTYDSGDYRKAFDLALERLRYEELRAKQKGTDPRGRHLTGVGIASYVEMSAIGDEYGSAELREDGSVFVRTGSSPHGQGHYTTWTQLVVEQIGVDPAVVTVIHGDTALVPRGGGTYGSKSSSLAGSAIDAAARTVAGELRRLAASRLEAAPVDIVLVNGHAEVIGSPGSGVSLATLAAEAGGKVEAENVFEGRGQNHP